ncbi:MAG: LytTR family DNA-binding domain-containing protein [Bacteroidota bacterium]
MRSVIIEDEAPALQIMEAYVDKTPMLELVASFRNPMEAVRFLQAGEIDLLFVDINMPELNGMDVVRSLTRPPLVIFTTAYSQYAADSYELDAIDYLLKPIQFDRFLRAVNKAVQRLNDRNKPPLPSAPDSSAADRFFVKSGHKTFQVNTAELLYIASENNYVRYVTYNKEILSLDSLSQLEKQLPNDQFIRVHKSFIVAISQIDTLQKEFITIRAKRIPIGRAYRRRFFDQIDKMGRKGG